MKRYTSLLLLSALLIITVLAGSAYMAGANTGESKRLKPMREITAYTTLPVNTAALLAGEYEAETRIRVNFLPLSGKEVLKRLADREHPEAALVLADEELLRRGAAEDYFRPYISEVGDQVPDVFKETEGRWTGVWYDPVVFCLNRDYLKSLTYIPDTWGAVAAMPDVRIGVTDFMAADAAANLLYSMIAQYGDVNAYRVWRGIHPKVVQYTKFLANPVRQTGMGEADLSVAVQSEALRGLGEGYPLKIIYPADGTAYMLTGTALTKDATAEDALAAQNFADWLLSDNAQLALQRHDLYFVTTNPGTMAYKTFAGKNIVLFDQKLYFTPQEKHDFLDRWVKYIRFQ